MSVKPILFNTDEVRAILDGRKTVTRRIIDEKVKDHWDSRFWECEHPIKYCKYQIGDILWVRETFCDCIPYFGYLPDIQRYVYKTNETKASMELRKSYGIVWTPSIHMPKEAARIFLQVTDVKAERLQDITEEQAKAEGCIDFNDKIGNGKFDDVMEFDLTARDAFAELWNSTVKEDWQKFASSPWVWVIEFERCEKPERWCKK